MILRKMMQKKQNKSSFRPVFCACILLFVFVPAFFAQSKELDSYQQLMMQALNTGTFPTQAHSILEKLQDVESYETLVLRLLAVPNLRQEHKLIVLLELLSLYELQQRWSEVPDIYRQLMEIKPQDSNYALQFCIALIASGEAEKAASALGRIPGDDTAIREYKTLLSMWIQFTIYFGKIKEQDILVLANSKNAVIRISSLQLLMLVSHGQNQEDYARVLRAYSEMDYSFFSSVQRYMLSLPLMLAKNPILADSFGPEQTKPDTPGSGSITIQAGAFSKYENAFKLKEQLEKLGYTVKIIQRTSDSIYLVLVYSETANYQSVILKLKDQGIEAWLVSD